MKTKWCLLMMAVVSLMMPRGAKATGACTAARFHDWNDMGCNQNHAGAGSPPKPRSCNDCGMPRWWVNEPYVNLWMSDTPLSYTLSSGQSMDFQFFYRQRYKMPDGDEVQDCPLLRSTLKSIGVIAESYFRTAHTNNASSYMTNAFWGNNWMANIYYWNAKPSATSFQNGGYQALVFQPDGGISYFYNTNYIYFTNVVPYIATNWYPSVRDPKSQMQIQPLSGLPYPTMASNSPAADSNGIYWGNPQTNGFQLIYPDGSKDVFGLCSINGEVGAISSLYIDEPCGYALLSQRIDPQGRITRIGYELYTNALTFRAYRVRYVVDSDGRTNTFKYVSTTNENAWLVSEIDDPYGRQVQLSYSANGIFTTLVDAAGLTNSFAYQGNNGWITNLTTPYGKTGFNFYETLDTGVTDGYQQRAIYISEPTGAQQLYYYQHNNSSLLTTEIPPAVPGQTNFDDGSTGGLSGHATLNYRNTFHWGRRQFAALSPSVQTTIISSLSDALNNLTSTDFTLARTRHWLMASNDEISITEALSSERAPSPDVAGQIAGLRTWYNYTGKPSPELLGGNPQVSCIARLLPDSTSQYTTYNYYPLTYTNGGSGLASDNESTFSLPDGTIGVLTNWFVYATNSVDLISVSNSAGQYVNYGYNGSHQITTATNALNQVTTLSWDSYTHNLTGVQLPAGKNYSLGYYSAATPPTSTSALLHTLNISPEGRSLTINDYQAGNPSDVTDDLGLHVTSTWDGLNRLTSSVFPDTTTISNLFSRLDLVGTKDRLGHWTYFGYDGLQHLTSVTNRNNAVTFYTWCGCGSLESIVDAETKMTAFHYDNHGNLTNVAFPDNSSITWQFDLAGRMTNVYDGAGRYLNFTYNNQGLATNIASANGTLRTATFDGLNRPITVKDGNGVTVTNTFDAINELLARTWPDNASEGFGYTNGFLMAYTNRDQKVTRYGRDAAGRLTSVTNANLEVTKFGYDSLDNVNSLIDGLLHQTTWQYNEYGWLTNKIDGLTRNAFRYQYNANGWVTNRWTPEKGNTGYTYDNVGNLKSITYPSSAITYDYDAVNRLTNMVDAVGTTKFTYTEVGQLKTEDGPWASDTLTYGYTEGLQTALTLAQASGNWSQTYGYDSGWRMTNIVSPVGTFVYSYNFQPASSLVTGISLPNGANIVNSYDSLARLMGTALNNYWGHTLDGYTYIPDPLGLRTNIVRDLGLTTSTVTAGYDNIGQLTSWNAKEAGGTLRQNEQLAYGYDAAHNLHTRNNGSLTQTFTTDAANQLNSVGRSGTFTMSGATPAPATSVTVNDQAAQTYGDFTYAATGLTLASGPNIFTNIAQNVYGLKKTNIVTLDLPVTVNLSSDNNGNLTNDGTRTFGFDAENQLTNVTLTGVWKSDFVYDGLNRLRVATNYNWSGGTWVLADVAHYVYDGRLLMQERDANNNVLVTYTRGLDMSGGLYGAGGTGGLLARTDTSGSTFYHADEAGNVTALMDGNENIVARYLYNPYGKLIGEWGALAEANTMRFSSKPMRRGLVDFGLRWYSPDLNRWLNQDPIQERGGINLYAYVENNPVNRIDPLGLWDYMAEPEGPPGGAGAAAPAMMNIAAIEAIAVVDPFAAAMMAAMWADQAKDGKDDKKPCPSNNGSGNQPMMGMAAPNNGVGPQHGGNVHNQMIDDYINSLPSDAQNIRKNQQQVDIDGNVVGDNRPDIQYDLNGKHYNVELDTNWRNSIKHFEEIIKNDPVAPIELIF